MSLRPDFVISDSHWGHKNIVAYADRPYDHEAMMIKRWRSTVNPNHTVLHLGDLFFARKGGEKRFVEEIAPQLTGKRRYLILGNHDKRDFDYEACGFTVLEPYSINYRSFEVSFSHYPRIVANEEQRIHVHGHVHRYYSGGMETRPNNVNCCVEALDYRPQRLTKLLNTAILARKSHGSKYYNSGSYRQSTTARGRRRAA